LKELANKISNEIISYLNKSTNEIDLNLYDEVLLDTIKNLDLEEEVEKYINKDLTNDLLDEIYNIVSNEFEIKEV